MVPISSIGTGSDSIAKLLAGPDFKITSQPDAGVAQTGGDATPGGGGGGSFGSMLADKIGALSDTMNQADAASQALATGQAKDISSVVMQVEKASLELQLASQIRNKAVDAYQDLFRMQV
jgi:flagellar hook-basal body complex protein FliE